MELNEDKQLSQAMLFSIASALAKGEWRFPLKIELEFQQDEKGPYIVMAISMPYEDGSPSSWTGIVWPDGNQIQIETIEEF